MSGCDDSLEQIDCDLLQERYGARVAIRRVMRKVYDRLDDRKRARLESVMKLWCEDGRLTPEMFNGNEGRSPRNNIMLQAFKAFKVRLYGFSTAIGGQRTFVIVDADAAKKQNKADRKILKRSKVRVDDLFDEIQEKGARHGAR